MNLVGRGELCAERRAETPAEPAGRAKREQSAGLFARAMIGPQRIFVEDDGVLADRLADRARQIFRRNVLAGRGILGQLRAPCTHAFGQPRAAGGDAASAICSRGSSAAASAARECPASAWMARSLESSALDSAHKTALRRYGRHGSRPADAANAESTAHRFPARSPDRRRRAARRARSRNASDGSTAGRPCAGCA